MIKDLIPFYMLLKLYYEGVFCKLEFAKYHEIVEALTDENLYSDALIKKDIDALRNVSEDDYQSLEYAYNKLFVGPVRLKAAPFESAYTNDYGVTMQDETLAVRSLYRLNGFKVVNYNKEPDDHIKFELEFILSLLDEEKYNSYSLFLKEHLNLYVKKHVELIKAASEHPFVLAMADLFADVIEIANKMEETK